MTDHQTSVTAYLKGVFEDIDGIEFVGEMPDDIDRIGQKNCILLEDGNEISDKSEYANKAVAITYDLNAWLYVRKMKTSSINTRSKSVNEYKTKVINEALKDYTFGGISGASNIKYVGCERGEPRKENDYYETGKSGDLNVVKITFSVTVTSQVSF